MITEEQLKQFAPGASYKVLPIVTRWFNELCNQYEVNTPLRIAAFFAQVIHESGSFNYVHEIASGDAYEGRKDLGNDFPGDGRKYKGRAYLQITGRANYKTVSRAIFNDEKILLNNPDLLATPKYAMVASLWWWHDRNLNKYADMPLDKTVGTAHHGTVTPFESITLIINGGFNGLQERIKNYDRICDVLGLPHWKKLQP